MTPHEFMREYETSGQLHGPDHTLRLIDDQAVFWFSNGTSHVGKEQIERAIRTNFEIIKNEEYRLDDLTWVAQSSDIAVCIYRFKWSGLVHGEPASGEGRGTSVLIRHGDSWLVVHEHLSKKRPDA